MGLFRIKTFVLKLYVKVSERIFFPVLTKIGSLLNLLAHRGYTILFYDRSTRRYKLVIVGSVDVVGCFVF